MRHTPQIADLLLEIPEPATKKEKRQASDVIEIRTELTARPTRFQTASRRSRGRHFEEPGRNKAPCERNDEHCSARLSGRATASADRILPKPAELDTTRRGRRSPPGDTRRRE